MALKYNSRALLENKLSILKCCIGTKAIEVSNSIALVLGDVSCKIQELEILNQYYDTLSCYYPYDCIPIIETIITPEHLYERLHNDNTVFDNVEIGMGLGNTFTFDIKNLLTLVTTTGIAIPYSTTDPVEIFDYVNNYINTNSVALGYTSSYIITPITNDITFTITVNSCDLMNSQSEINTTTWGFAIRQNGTNIFPLLQASTVFPLNPSYCESSTEEITGEDCCNIKITPEILEYTLDTAQFLETLPGTIVASGVTNSVATFNTFLSSGTYVDIYAVIDSCLVIPHNQILIKYRNPISFADFILFVKTYINNNPSLFGYSMDYTLQVSGNYNIIYTILQCDLVYNNQPTAGFAGYSTITPNTNYTRLFGTDLQSIGVALILNSEETSTCPIYTNTISREEIVECIENCLTDEQAEKMIRHAISLCECCVDIKIDNEPFN